MKKIIIHTIVIILAAGLFSQPGVSQNLIRTNPADLTDPQALFINPAILPYQNLSFNMGMKIYHVGFLSDNSTGLKYSYNSNSFPNVLLNGIGIGLNLQSFNTPYLNNAGIGLALGYSISPVFSVGVSAHGSNLSYDPSKFDLIDFGDPVFSNGTGRWNVSFGAGFLIRPMEKLTVGLSANNINRPDLSLMKDGARLPFELDFGLKYYLGRIFSASVFSHYQDGQLTPGIVFEANVSSRALVKSGLVDKGWMFEGHLNLVNGFGINYRLDYPFWEANKVSYGSHQLGVTWNMKFNPDYTFNIDCSVDTIRLIKEYTKIRIEKNVYQDKIFSMLDYYDLQFSQETRTDQDTLLESTGMALDDISASYNDQLEAYAENFRVISDYLNRTNQKLKIDIYAQDAISGERAAAIKKFLVDSMGFDAKDVRFHRESNGVNREKVWQQTKKDSILNLIESSTDLLTNSQYIEITSPPIECMVPDTIHFYITNARIRRVSQWRILITNIFREPIHEIPGVQNIPDVVSWDGFKDDGTLVDVGNYYYQFQYSIGGGNRWIPKRPKRHRLVFIRVNRAKTIEITSGAVDDIEMLKGVIIRLKEPGDFNSAKNAPEISTINNGEPGNGKK